jgi:large subunit ribosomal protein L29
MKGREVRTFDDADLVQRANDLREELFNLRFQYATHQLTNHARMRVVRRDIARIQTVLHQRELMRQAI